MRNSFKYLVGILLLSATLNACGGAAGNEASNVGGENSGQVRAPAAQPEKSFEERAQEWAAFVNTRPLEDERLQVFTELNAGGCCGIAADLSAYLNRLGAEDSEFASLASQMRIADTELVHHAQCLVGGSSLVRACETDQTHSFGELHAVALLADYSALLGRTNAARERLILTASILDWSIVPAAELPAEIASSFTDSINQAIRDVADNDPAAFSGGPAPQIDASLLQAASLRLDDGSLQSFFQFSIVTDGSVGSLGLVAAGQNNLINVFHF